jgi:hypothetical protein
VSARPKTLGGIGLSLLFPAFSAHSLAVPLSRIAWLCTVAACVITAILLLVSGYDGYALLAVAVGLSASINLR